LFTKRLADFVRQIGLEWSESGVKKAWALGREACRVL
jgi:hypothetical protein